MAALPIGDIILEFHQDSFLLSGTRLTPSDRPLTFGGDYKYTITNAPIEQGKNAKFYQYYKVDLNKDLSILFKFYKNFLTISVDSDAADFGDSVGLLGDHATGDMVSRDGIVMEDFTLFAFEWQTNPEDPKLFFDSQSPQLPFEVCRMPTAARPARRLRHNFALMEIAQTACACVRGSSFDLCVEDVVATGDGGLASLW